MSLNKPAFESQESTDAAALAQAKLEKPVETAAAPTAAPAVAATPVAEAAKEATSTAVAAKTSTGLAAPREGSIAALLKESNFLATLDNAMPVTWEDFDTINATQGQFQHKTENAPIGDNLVLRVISTQEQFVSSPGDMDADGDGLVLYSDDGVNASEESQEYEEHIEWLEGQGITDRTKMTVKEHQAWLKAADHKNAHVQHKLILVGVLVSCPNEKALDLVGKMVKVNLPDTGRRAFNNHAKQSSFHISQGLISAADVSFIEMKTKMAGTGKKLYTQVKLAYAKGHGAEIDFAAAMKL